MASAVIRESESFQRPLRSMVSSVPIRSIFRVLHDDRDRPANSTKAMNRCRISVDFKVVFYVLQFWFQNFVILLIQTTQIVQKTVDKFFYRSEEHTSELQS